MDKRCSKAAVLLRNCLPDGETQPLAFPLALPRQIQPLAVEIESFAKDSLEDLMEEEEEMRMAESCEEFIIPDMNVDWLESSMPISSMEKLVKLESEVKVELVARVEE